MHTAMRIGQGVLDRLRAANLTRGVFYGLYALLNAHTSSRRGERSDGGECVVRCGDRRDLAAGGDSRARLPA